MRKSIRCLRLGKWIFVNQVMAGRLVLFNLAETLAGLEPAVVGPIVAHPADFTADGVSFSADPDSRALFTPELMDQSWRNAKTAARIKSQYFTSVMTSRLTINVNGKITLRAPAIQCRLVKPDHDVPSAAIDNVLHLVAMKMQWWFLIFRIEDEFFRIILAGIVIGGTIAQGKESAAKFVKVALAEVGDIPAEHAAADFLDILTFVFPVLHGPGGKGRQMKAYRSEDLFGCFNGLVDEGAFQWSLLY